MAEQDNKKGQAINAFGIVIIIIGVIAAFVLLGQANNTYGENDVALQINAAIIFASSVLSGTLFIGIGEIINLLDDINRN